MTAEIAKGKASRKISSVIRGLKMVIFDFDGVFTDNRVLVMQDGTEGVMCDRSDGLGIAKLREIGIITLVLSKEKNPVVGARCRKLGLACIQGCDDKVGMLMKESERLGIPLRNIAYIGNDINDLECLEIVGLPVCVADAYPEVMAISKLVTVRNGGCGAVREFCDYVAELRKKAKVK